MQEFGLKSKKADLNSLGIKVREAHWNLSQAELIEEAIKNREGHAPATRRTATQGAGGQKPGIKYCAALFGGRFLFALVYALHGQLCHRDHPGSLAQSDFGYECAQFYGAHAADQCTVFADDGTLSERTFADCAGVQYFSGGFSGVP